MRRKVDPFAKTPREPAAHGNAEETERSSPSGDEAFELSRLWVTAAGQRTSHATRNEILPHTGSPAIGMTPEEEARRMDDPTWCRSVGELVTGVLGKALCIVGDAVIQRHAADGW